MAEREAADRIGADRRLRALEREHAAGEPTARARLLRERARQGVLRPERLELAAHLGDADARASLDAEVEGPREDGDLREWTWDLLPFGLPVVVRAIVSAVDSLVLDYTEQHPDDPAPQDALDTVVAWCEAPNPDRCPELHAAAQAVLRSTQVSSMTAAGAPDQHMSVIAFAAFRATRTALLAAEDASDKRVLHEASVTLQTLRAAGQSDGELRETIRAALLDWALE